MFKIVDYSILLPKMLHFCAGLSVAYLMYCPTYIFCLNLRHKSYFELWNMFEFDKFIILREIKNTKHEISFTLGVFYTNHTSVVCTSFGNKQYLY